MALPRRFWVLVGWVIALATLAAAAGVVESMYRDLYGVAGCTEPAAAADYPVCSRFLMVEGAAEVAGVVVKVPAFGLAAIAAAVGLSARRDARLRASATRPGQARARPTPLVAHALEEQEEQEEPQEPAGPDRPADAPAADATGKRRRVRRRARTDKTAQEGAEPAPGSAG